jgi:hypothetical protein
MPLKIEINFKELVLEGKIIGQMQWNRALTKYA